MTIKVKLYNGQKVPKVIKKGDWIDIYTVSEIRLCEPYANALKRNRKGGQDNSTRNVQFNPQFVSLNMAMKLPEGYEAIVAPRSSAFKRWGILLSNSIGIIDSSFCGNADVWGAYLLPTKNAVIPARTAFLQFRIQPSQKATLWQRIKWLFSSGKINFVETNNLKDESRGGFGSTDEKKQA